MALESKAETAGAKAMPAGESVAAFPPSRPLVTNTQLLQQAKPAAWGLQRPPLQVPVILPSLGTWPSAAR